MHILSQYYVRAQDVYISRIISNAGFIPQKYFRRREIKQHQFCLCFSVVSETDPTIQVRYNFLYQYLERYYTIVYPTFWVFGHNCNFIPKRDQGFVLTTFGISIHLKITFQNCCNLIFFKWMSPCFKGKKFHTPQ